MILVPPFDTFRLPTEKSQLVLLHGIHANGSMAMSFEVGPSTFTCPHCGYRFNLSDAFYTKILSGISQEKEKIECAPVGGGAVTYFCIAHTIDEDEDFPKESQSGVYYVKIAEDE